MAFQQGKLIKTQNNYSKSLSPSQVTNGSGDRLCF